MSVKSCVECSKRAHGKICSWELLTVNIWVWLIRKIEVISVIWVNCNSVTSRSVCKWILLSSTEEDLLSGHPRAAKKVFVPGAGRLRECKKNESASQSVRYDLHCIMYFGVVSTICLLHAVHFTQNTIVFDWNAQAKPWLRLNNRSLRCAAPFSAKAKNKDTLASTCPQIDGNNWSSRRVKERQKCN